MPLGIYFVILTNVTNKLFNIKIYLMLIKKFIYMTLSYRHRIGYSKGIMNTCLSYYIN